MIGPDLRKARRYGLPLPVTIRYSLENLPITRIGKITDISSDGVYFVVGENPGLGTQIKVTLTIPREISGSSEVLIHFLGKVLRVESPPGHDLEKFGVAVSIQKYDLIRNNRKI